MGNDSGYQGPMKTRQPNPRPTYSWPRLQVRLPPDMRELLGAYSTLLEVKSGGVVRTLLKHHLASIFGRGVGLPDALSRIKSLDPQSRQSLIVKIKEEFESLL